MSAKGRSRARIAPKREARRVVQFAKGRSRARIAPKREARRVVQ
jgi:hypothetical protein